MRAHQPCGHARISLRGYVSAHSQSFLSLLLPAVAMAVETGAIGITHGPGALAAEPPQPPEGGAVRDFVTPYLSVEMLAPRNTLVTRNAVVVSKLSL